MRAFAKGHVSSRILSLNVELVWIGELGRVAIGCCIAQEDHRTALELMAAKLAIPRDDAPHAGSWRVQTEDFLYRIGDQFGVRP